MNFQTYTVNNYINKLNALLAEHGDLYILERLQEGGEDTLNDELPQPRVVTVEQLDKDHSSTYETWDDPLEDHVVKHIKKKGKAIII